jgi:hypothetical protein
MADTIRAASPSSEPTATVKVVADNTSDIRKDPSL